MLTNNYFSIGLLSCDFVSINFALYSEENIEMKDDKLKKEVTCIITDQD